MEAVNKIIENKKQQKFNKMIERGAKIAAQSRGLAINDIVSSSIQTEGEETSESKANTKAVMKAADLTKETT